MEIAMSLIYLLAYCLSIFVIAACIKELTLLRAIPFACLLVVGVNSIVFALLGLIGLGYSPLLSLLVNLMTAAVGFRFGIKKGALTKQALLKNIATKNDVIAWVLLGLVALCFFLVRYGFPPQPVFVSGDAAAHFQGLRELFEGGIAKGQYCSYLFAAMLMSSLGGLCGLDNLLGLFIVSETVILYLGGLCFYALACSLFPGANRFCLISFLSVVYMCGMPMMSLLFGFSYLCFSVVVITGILLFATRVQKGGRFADRIALSLLLFELVISYSLFVPAIYMAVFIALVAVLIKRKATIKRFIKEIALVFLVPVLVGCPLVFLALFGDSAGHSVGSALQLQGGTYLETYGQYLVFLPLIIYGIYCAIKQRDCFSINVVFVVFIVFTLVMGLLLVADKASPYYFSKTVNVLWLGAFVYITCGLNELMAKSKAMVASFAAAYLLMFVAFVAGIDKPVIDHGYDSVSIGESFFPIHAQNKARIHDGRVSDTLFEAYEEMDSLPPLGEGESEAKIGVLNAGLTSSRWFSALYSRQAHIPHWSYADEEVFDMVEQCDYIFVGSGGGGFATKSGTPYPEFREALLAEIPGEVIFTNESGEIIKVGH